MNKTVIFSVTWKNNEVVNLYPTILAQETKQINKQNEVN